MTTNGVPQTRPLVERWPAVPDAVAPIRHAIVSYAERAGASQRTAQAVALAVSEAATNVVLHAYPDPRSRGDVTVTAELIGPNMLLILVADDGRGMTPRPDSPGLGLGLPLIAQVVESIQIVAAPGGGTEVRMRFALAA